MGFNAYKGLPGPYIKWFLKNVNVEGLAKMVEPFEDKTSFAMCITAYMAPDLKEHNESISSFYHQVLTFFFF